MAITISKNLPYQLLFALCIAIPYLNIYELTFAIWILTLLVTIRKTYSINILKIVSCFVAILTIAFISGLFRKYPLYVIIRDITYLLKPIIGILAGYQLCKYNSQKAFKTIVYTGLSIALIHIFIVFTVFLKYHTLTVVLIREYGGYFSDFEIFVLVILMFYKKFELNFSKNNRLVFLSIIGFSCFLYLARTNMIQFVILFIAMKGYLKINKKSIYVITSVIIAILVGYAAVLYINPRRNGKGLEAFLYKVKIAPIEPFKTKINKEDWKDFNDNYRSFESITTVKQVTEDGNSAVFFGKGLGATINLGRRVLSNDGTYVQEIAIVHNGYMTVFLKSGLLGVFFLFLSIYYLSKTKNSEIDLSNNINLILIGTAIFMIFSYFVFLGFYFKFDCKSVLVGFIIAIQERINKENKMNLLQD